MAKHLNYGKRFRGCGVDSRQQAAKHACGLSDSGRYKRHWLTRKAAKGEVSTKSRQALWLAQERLACRQVPSLPKLKFMGET